MNFQMKCCYVNTIKTTTFKRNKQNAVVTWKLLIHLLSYKDFLFCKLFPCAQTVTLFNMVHCANDANSCETYFR